MMRAVFVEPTGDLLAFIRRWKARFDSVLPGQPLTAHPPHCTLIAARCQPREGGMRSIANGITVRPFTCSTLERVRIFEEDPMSDGGHTAVIEVAESSELRALQNDAANAMREIIDVGAAKQTAKGLRDPVLRASQKKFGFPFVGTHWIPHFTIGSPRVDRAHALLAALESELCQFTFRVSSVSLWDLDADPHRRIETIPLAGD